MDLIRGNFFVAECLTERLQKRSSHAFLFSFCGDFHGAPGVGSGDSSTHGARQRVDGLTLFLRLPIPRLY